VKYLAILKDSLLEAIDTKVFYVMVGLSCLLTLVVASVSFQAVPAEEALKRIANGSARVYRDRGRSLHGDDRPIRYTFEGLEQLNDATQPQAGDYQFTLIAPEMELRKAASVWSLPADSEATAPPFGALTDDVLQDFVKSQFSMYGGVEFTKVERAKTSKPGDVAFLVETKGSKGARGWLHDPCLFFGAVPITSLGQSLGVYIYFIEGLLVNGIGAWVGILIGVVITAFFIPNMLRKGTIDLLLAKPIHRTTLLIYKYIGGLTFVFLNSLVAVGGMWLAIGFRSGIWATGFLLTIFVLTFFFAVLYAVSALFSVLTRSAIVSILMTFAAWFLLWIVGTGYTQLEVIRNDAVLSKQMPVPGWIYATVSKIHYVLPRTKDLDILTTKLLLRGVMTEGEIRTQKLDVLPQVTWGESLAVSAIFIAVMLGLACWRFARADY